MDLILALLIKIIIPILKIKGKILVRKEAIAYIFNLKEKSHIKFLKVEDYALQKEKIRIIQNLGQFI